MKSDFFINNRRKLRERVGPGLIVVTANGLLQRWANSTFPFRQDSNFWYLTGLDEPDLTLVMDEGREYIILPRREEIRNIFDGYVDSVQLKKISGVDSVLSEAQGWPPLNQKLKTVKEVFILQPLPRFVRGYDFYSSPARRHMKDRLRRTNAKLTFHDIREDLAVLRVIKDPQEIAMIQEAIDITVDTLKFVAKKIPKMKTEDEVAALLTYEYRRRGATGDAFPAIVASGKSASTVHHRGGGKIYNNKLLLLDTGAEVSNYAADISRTVQVGKPTRRHLAILEAAKRAQDYALSLIQPGQNFYEYEVLVHKFVGEELKKLGVIKTASRKSISKYFPHATSHYVGLDVHDVGDRHQEFKENMVLAVEPGILIPEEGVGVRIEDVVVVTKDGCRNMSKNLPALL